MMTVGKVVHKDSQHGPLHCRKAAAAGGLRRSGDALIAPEGLRASILQKFDWLGLASTEKLLPAWNNLFATINPAVLAPVHGRVQFGAELVAGVLADYRTALFFSDSPAAGHPALAQGVSG